MISPFNSCVGLTHAQQGIRPLAARRASPRPAAATASTVYPDGTTCRAPHSRWSHATKAARRVHVVAADDGVPGSGAADGDRIRDSRRTARPRGRRTLAASVHRGQRAIQRLAAPGSRVPGRKTVFLEQIFLGTERRAGRSATCAASPRADRFEHSSLPQTGSPRWRCCHRRAGPSARGVDVSLAGTVAERLPPAARAWSRRFAETQADGEGRPFRSLRRRGGSRGHSSTPSRAHTAP